MDALTFRVARIPIRTLAGAAPDDGRMAPGIPVKWPLADLPESRLYTGQSDEWGGGGR